MFRMYRYAILALLLSVFINAQQKQVLTIKDIMKFENIFDKEISNEGNFAAYSVKPDRGNGYLVIKNIIKDTQHKIEKAEKPVFSTDEKWVGFKKVPDFKMQDKKDKPKEDFILFNLANADSIRYQRVNEIKFSDNSKWISIHHYEPDNKDEKGKEKKKYFGSRLILRNLLSGKEKRIDNVVNADFDKKSERFVYTVSDTSGNNGIYLINLSDNNTNSEAIDKSQDYFTGISFAKSGEMVFTKTKIIKNAPVDSAEVWLYAESKQLKKIASTYKIAKGFVIPFKSSFEWTADSKRLYFGIKESLKKSSNPAGDTNDIYNIDNIVSKNGAVVWHSEDPMIKTHAKIDYEKNKDFLYKVMYDFNSGKLIYLADKSLPNVEFTHNTNITIGTNPKPYLKEITWDGKYSDLYMVNLKNGSRAKIASRLSEKSYLSPKGNYVLYFNSANWFVYDVKKNKHFNVTGNMRVKFYDDDKDTPDNPEAYGFGGWIEEDSGFFIYDKYDIWKIKTANLETVNHTDGFGRKNKIQLRILTLDKDRNNLKYNEKLLLSGYNENLKYTNFYRSDVGGTLPYKLGQDNKRYALVKKVKNADKIFYTRETYREYPDLFIADLEFKEYKKISDLGKQTEKYLWGNAELVEWTSADGENLHGMLIKPENYDPKKRYPVVVYYYEISSNRLFNFPEVVINHRPNFPYYSGNDYVIFLPDIKYEIGRPGLSAVKCLVPGVQKLVDMGLADPKAIGLHGHSWGGYQTAFVVTQTNIFACAIAGAPVANMTSAYGGIRWGEGIARQFQYEKQQSRIGKNLWEARDAYIENSALFFADKINTPLLLQHGDIDEAVPWYQSIEYYLAMRRLGKECVFLQYKDEPHHLKKYTNKLDYTIKMMEYFDHYLKKKPAADWIKKGIPYSE